MNIPMDTYTDEIKAILSEKANTEIQKKLLRLVPGAKCIGVSVPDIRLLVKEFKQKLSNPTAEELCALMDDLCKNQCREEIFFGIFLIAGFTNIFSAIPWEKIIFWLNVVDNWETCDQLSSNIAAPKMSKNISLVEELILLTGSSNLWKRRFAAATAANINHGGRQFPDQTLNICKILLADKEIMVTKAIGWALRELSKKTPEIVFEFLFTNKGHIPVRLMRESSEKLNKEQQEILMANQAIQTDRNQRGGS